MARRRSMSPKWFERHRGTYARTTDVWTTRYYSRKQDPDFNLLGLNTKPSDFNKSPDSASYLTNVRYMGEKEESQRAPLMSRDGAKFTGTLGEDKFPREISDGNTYLPLYEGHAIEWLVLHNRLLTGLSFYLHNQDHATGFIKITVRNAITKEQITDAVIDVSSISTDEFSFHEVRTIKTVVDTQVLVRMEVVNDRKTETTNTPHIIRVLAETSGTHRYADYELPNVDEALKEVPLDFKEAPSAPLTGVMVNDWEPLPRSYKFRSGGRYYIAFPVRHDNVVELYKQDILTGDITLLSSQVHPDTEAVRYADAEGFLYYVDGYSPLRRINLTTWAVEDVVPKPEEITVPGVDPATLTAKPGASLIHFLQNRIYLSGFKDDPNLVIMSLIDNVKPRFEQYNDRFYSPDQSPEAAASSPITALEDINNYLIVWRVDGFSLYDRGSSAILEDAAQITPEGGQLGVLNQEAVCKGKNNIYFYNPVEGVCRFGGTLYRNVSGDIENLFSRIKNRDKVFMVYHNKRVRMYFSFDGDKPDSCLYYYTELEGRLPWYMDVNTPVSSAVVDDATETLYAIHSEVATTYEVDAAPFDFDSNIRLQYNTQYTIPATTSPDGYSIVRRIHVHDVAQKDHSMFIGLDIDNQDRPTVWRKYVEADVQEAVNPDAVFQQTAEAGEKVVDIMCYIKCRRYQVRVVIDTYGVKALINGISVEYGDIRPI